MKQLATLLLSFLLISLASCNSSGTNPEVLEKFSGRYYYTADETIRIHSANDKLLIDWRGAENIAPMKVGENTYFVKEMNTKIQLLENPDDGKAYLVFVPKDKDSAIEFKYVKLAADYKTPTEYFEAGNYEKALEGYMAIRAQDSLNPIIEEWKLNRRGYRYLQQDDFEKARELFKINIALYPNSANVYDSYAEALYKSGDTAAAISNYEKVLSMDSGNRNAKRRLSRLSRKQE